MRIPYHALLVCILSFCFFACTKEAPAPYIKVDKTALNPAPEGLMYDSIIVSTNVPWQVSVSLADLNWVLPLKDTGSAGTTTLYLRIYPNPLNAKRTATLTFRSRTEPATPVTVTVTQSNDVEIYSFTPQAVGGATISIIGRGFSDTSSENKVTINGVPTEVLSATNTYLTVTVPPKVGNGPIIVSVNDKADTSDYDFLYGWTGLVTTIAGSTIGYKDGAGINAQFNGPMGLDMDASGNLYVADDGNYNIRKITPTGTVTTFAGSTIGHIGTIAESPFFSLPSDVAFDVSGNLYVSESNREAISKVTVDGVATTLAGGGYVRGFADGIGAKAQFYSPWGIVVDATGNVYVADRENNRVRKVTPDGVVTTFAGGSRGFAEGTAEAAKFNEPTGIALDPAGNIYVADYYNDRIRKITPAGLVTTYAGGGSGSYAGNDGQADAASIFRPVAIAMDKNGTLYVGDTFNTIRLITPDGKVSSVLVCTDAVSGAPVSFNGIWGLYVDAAGTIYVSDRGNHIIRKVVLK